MSAQERADQIRARHRQGRAQGLTPALTSTLASIHPDTFVQGAIWRLYVEAPVALAASVFLALWDAEKTDQPQAVRW